MLAVQSSHFQFTLLLHSDHQHYTPNAILILGSAFETCHYEPPQHKPVIGVSCRTQRGARPICLWLSPRFSLEPHTHICVRSAAVLSCALAKSQRKSANLPGFARAAPKPRHEPSREALYLNLTSDLPDIGCLRTLLPLLRVKLNLIAFLQ